MAHRHRGDERMRDIIAELEEIGKLETDPRMAGRRMSVIIGPDKRKIEAYRRKMEAEGKATEEKDPKVAEEAEEVAKAEAAENSESAED
jgi:Spy/CpxP family protein refolding chaperone